MADVFISYRNTPERRAIVSRLATILRAHGASVWWDFGLEAGQRYREQIAGELAAAKAVVVLWCEESVQSQWVLMEAELGKDKLLPARLQNVVPPPAFEGIQSANLIDWDGAVDDFRTARFVAEVMARIGGTQKPLGDMLEELRHLPRLSPLGQAGGQKAAPSVSRQAPGNEGGGLKRRLGVAALVIGLAVGVGAMAVIALQSPWGAQSVATDNVMATEQAESPEAPEPRVDEAPPALEAAATPPRAPNEPPPRDAAGSVFDDCGGAAWCPRMVTVPGGAFIMGAPPTEPGREDDEGPQRQVSLASFAIGQHEVSRNQWTAFVRDAGYESARRQDCFTSADQAGSWDAPGFYQEGDHPIVCVTWNDAKAFADWLSRKTGAAYRLPTEAEWEYAARGGTRSVFWWGARLGPSHANGGDSGINGTTRPGRYPANPFGLLDTAGNAAEWVMDCYRPSYSGAPSNGNAVEAQGCAERVVRGGSWGDRPSALRNANRNFSAPTDRGAIVGFRVARDLR